MKKHSNKVIYITFLLLLLPVISINNSKEILAIEKMEEDKIDFIDKGIKLEFDESNDEFINNKSKILSIDNKEFKVSETIDGTKRSMEAFNDNYQISYVQWQEKGVYLNTISIINNNKNTTLNEINIKIHNLGFNGKENLRYFQEIKGKIKSEDYKIDELNNALITMNAKSNEYLPIENGICGKVTFNNGKKLTYSINNYTSGKYLIIGTPMIFSTY